MEKIYHVSKPNNSRTFQNLYQDHASIDMRLNEFKYLTSTCWNEKEQPLTIDMTKTENTGLYRLGLDSVIVPDSSPF